MITVNKANLMDAHELAPRLGEMELLEISKCAPELTPMGVLRSSLTNVNDKVYAIRDSEDGCISMFGVHEINYKEGVAWMLNSAGFFDRHLTKRFLKESKEFITQKMQHFDMMYNFVSVQNKPSIRWLTWLGFTVVYEPLIITDEPFYFFYIRN